MSTYPLVPTVGNEDILQNNIDPDYKDLAYFIYDQLNEEDAYEATPVYYEETQQPIPKPRRNVCSARLKKLAEPKKLHVIENNNISVDVYRPGSTRTTRTRPIKTEPIFIEEKPAQRPILDWNNYHRLNVIHTFMDDLEYDYPSICTTGNIGTSLEGRELKILKISNSNASNEAVWIDAGIHAREWIAPATATYIANKIARNFSILPEYMTNKDWYFLPVMNPDGYEYSHTNDRMWRKNRAWHSGQCVGVDLNRNFSYGWGGKGSSSNPLNSFYHGPQPFSEPESSAVRDMLTTSGIPFSVYMTLHSYGQIILFPFAYRDELAPGYVRLLEGATVMSRAIYNTSGNTYKVGISRDVMYGAAGTSSDWSYGAAGIPYCYLLELRSKKHKFRLPQNEIEETGNEIYKSVLALMEFVDNYTPPNIGVDVKDSEESVESTQGYCRQSEGDVIDMLSTCYTEDD